MFNVFIDLSFSITSITLLCITLIISFENPIVNTSSSNVFNSFTVLRISFLVFSSISTSSSSSVSCSSSTVEYPSRCPRSSKLWTIFCIVLSVFWNILSSSFWSFLYSINVNCDSISWSFRFVFLIFHVCQ